MPKKKASKAKASSTKQSKSDPVSRILPYLFLGHCSATSPKSTFVARQGITHIISVGQKSRSTHEDVKRLYVPIEDSPFADLAEAGATAAAFIDEARSERKSSKIFVHCHAGISRSPAVVAFYLMRSHGMSLRRALTTIVSVRPEACPNPGFITQLLGAELELRGSSSLPSNLTSLPRKKEDRLALLQGDRLDTGTDVESSMSSSLQTFEAVEQG